MSGKVKDIVQFRKLFQGWLQRCVKEDQTDSLIIARGSDVQPSINGGREGSVQRNSENSTKSGNPQFASSPAQAAAQPTDRVLHTQPLSALHTKLQSNQPAVFLATNTNRATYG